MVFFVDKSSILNLFGVENFSSLKSVVDNMSPSLVEYYLASFCSNNDIVYFNKKDIENSIFVGKYNIYLDYNENMYLEVTQLNLDNVTKSLW